MYKKKINVKDYGKAIKKKGISRETGNIDEGKQNTICVVHHYVQTNPKNINKTCTHDKT